MWQGTAPDNVGYLKSCLARSSSTGHGAVFDGGDSADAARSSRPVTNGAFRLVLPVSKFNLML